MSAKARIAWKLVEGVALLVGMIAALLAILMVGQASGVTEILVENVIEVVQEQAPSVLCNDEGIDCAELNKALRKYNASN